MKNNRGAAMASLCKYCKTTVPWGTSEATETKKCDMCDVDKDNKNREEFVKIFATRLQPRMLSK